MPPIKKTSTKSAKSSTPATKTAKSAKKAPVAQPAPVAPAPEPLAAAVTPEVVTKLVASVAGTPPRPVTTKVVTTTIIAVLDVGFGNTLFIRGQGPGLSWDKGIPMTCIAPNEWQIVLPESARGYTFKVLVNDVTWSLGPDFVVESGGTVTITPEF